MAPRILAADPGHTVGRHRADIDSAIATVLDSGWFILGNNVMAFEQEFAEFIGAAHGVGVASGTDAVEIALRASGLRQGAGVLVPTNTAVATVAAIERAGGVPILCDIDKATYGISPTSVDEALRSATVPPEAIVVVHLYGLPIDLTAILATAAQHDLFVVEDCAQSHGATFGGRSVGTFGRAAAFSFYPTKNLGCIGDGGLLTTSDPAIDANARSIRQYGWRERYVSSEVGVNSRLDELQAAILRVLLPSLAGANDRRREIADRYLEELAGRALTLPIVPEGRTHVWHQFVVRTPDRDNLRDHLAKDGIGTAVLYPVPVHEQPAYRGRVPTAGALSIASRTAGEILSLPMGPHLSDDDVEAVINSICEWKRR